MTSQKQSTEDIVADYGAIKFSFLNEGKDLEVSFPNGVTETHHIYDLLKNGPRMIVNLLLLKAKDINLIFIDTMQKTTELEL